MFPLFLFYCLSLLLTDPVAPNLTQREKSLGQAWAHGKYSEGQGGNHESDGEEAGPSGRSVKCCTLWFSKM